MPNILGGFISKETTRKRTVKVVDYLKGEQNLVSIILDSKQVEHI